MTVGGLVAVTPQQMPDSERATIATRTVLRETTGPLFAHIVGNSVPPIVDSSNNDTKQISDGRDNALWSVPLASLTGAREHPIFSPTRRPPPAVVKVAATQAASAAEPLMALLGAIAGDNEGIAIFLDGTTKSVIRLKTGASHAGWTLQAVRPREAILQKEQKTAIIALPNPPAR